MRPTADLPMQPFSRTPEGEPNRCPVCGKPLQIEPSRPPGDAPCPHCGGLLIFGVRSDGGAVPTKATPELADELVQKGVLTQWQADNLIQGKYRGFHLGAYRILRPLGQGRTSKVFLAQHEMLGHRCAIKILPSRCLEDPRALDRLRLQAWAIMNLDHPNIVRGYDFNKDVRYSKQITFVVMEYVEGRNLHQTVTEDGPMDFVAAADLVGQAAEGLACADEAGIIHRNIEPANLMADPTGLLKIIGFVPFPPAEFQLPTGPVFEDEPPLPTADVKWRGMEALNYLAPEQVTAAMRCGDAFDGRADIYSLGLTYYYLLTGRPPFPRATLMELIRAHRHERPEPVITLRPDAPAEIIAIIDRMTAKSPAQRFQTAKEVARALRSWLRR